MGENKTVLGIDPSMTSTGYAELTVLPDGSTALSSYGLITIESLGLRRLSKAYDSMRNLLSILSPTCVMYENYSFGSRFGKLFQIGEIGGIFRLALHKAGYVQGENLFMVPPTTLKRFVTGKGNAQKEDVQAAILKRWGKNFFNNNDIADAYGLAKLGTYLQKKSTSGFTHAERDVVKILSRQKGRYLSE